MSIKIGTIESIGDPDSFEIKFDDRQERIEVIGGVFVYDAGYVEEGKVITVEATFAGSDWPTLEGYWLNRTKVTVVDHRNRTYTERRFKVTGFKDLPGLNMVNLIFELWAV